MHRFDTSKTNPHAYFSKVFERAFLRRIAKEKKQDYIRNKIKMEYLNLPDLDWVVEYERKNEVRLRVPIRVWYPHKGENGVSNSAQNFFLSFFCEQKKKFFSRFF